MTWGVEPSTAFGPNHRSHFVYSAAPGERIDDYVGVTNKSSADLTFNVYGTDAITTADGAFSLLPADRAPTDVGAWVRFERATYTVPAGQRADVPFSVTVPADASPGDHSGGVLASIASHATRADGRSINVDRRVGARVYLRVHGPIRRTLVVGEVRARLQTDVSLPGGHARVTYRITNTGNVRLSAVARVRVTGPLGVHLASSRPRRIGELLPGTARTVTERIAFIPAGRVVATLTVEPVASATDTEPSAPMAGVARRATMWGAPWALLLMAACGGLLFYFGAIRRAPSRRMVSPLITEFSQM